MKIVISEKDIKQALRNYVEELIALPDDSNFDIDIRAGRGPEGFTAEIKVNEEPEEVKTKATAAPTGARRGRKPKIKDPVVPETKTVENAVAQVEEAPVVPVVEQATDNAPTLPVETQVENTVEAQVETPAAEAAQATSEVVTETDSLEDYTPPSFLKKDSIFGNASKSVFDSQE